MNLEEDYFFKESTTNVVSVTVVSANAAFNRESAAALFKESMFSSDFLSLLQAVKPKAIAMIEMVNSFFMIF
jgi:hypothetical protein